MILVHRLRGEPLYLNPDLIEAIEATPDTVLTLVDGRKTVVADPVETVVDRILRFRASVLVMADQLRAEGAVTAGPGLRVVDGGGRLMAMFGGGAVFALGAIFLAMMMDGNSVGPLVGPSSFVIVMGGAFGAALMSIQSADISKIFKSLAYALTGTPPEKTDVIEQLGPLADVARREGMLALEGKLEEIEDPFVKLGIQQLVDGADADQIHEVMQIDIGALDERHKFGIDFWKAAGGFAPTFGMVGTVIGLINMLGNLSDPAQLGAGMSTALLTTLYGVLLSNVVFLPVSTRLDSLNKIELAARDVALDGILAIQAGVSSRLLVERLETYLAPAERGKGDGSQPIAEAA